MAAVNVATALVTMAGMSSMAYQLTKLMLYKAAEIGANTAIALLSRKPDSLGKVQFILMELDIEAKFKSVHSLLEAIENEKVETDVASRDFVQVCVENVREAMRVISKTLARVQAEMDNYAQMWFNKWRALDVVDDLHLLKAECKMFDKRLETLIQCLAVPVKGRAGETGSKDELVQQRILGDFSFTGNQVGEEMSETERMKSILMAERALREAELTCHSTQSKTSVSSYSENAKTKTLASGSTTTYIFEDPVFL